MRVGVGIQLAPGLRRYGWFDLYEHMDLTWSDSPAVFSVYSVRRMGPNSYSFQPVITVDLREMARLAREAL